MGIIPRLVVLPEWLFNNILISYAVHADNFSQLDTAICAVSSPAKLI